MQAMSGWAGSDETLGAETMKQVNCPMNRPLRLRCTPVTCPTAALAFESATHLLSTPVPAQARL
jgi:hypothetical protein